MHTIENKMNYPIYLYDIEVSYRKTKQTLIIKTWAVSKYDNAVEIMTRDHKTMDRLNDELYGSKYKGERKILITKILTKKKVGESQIYE